jgi:hypothetical protein
MKTNLYAAHKTVAKSSGKATGVLQRREHDQPTRHGQRITPGFPPKFSARSLSWPKIGLPADWARYVQKVVTVRQAKLARSSR